MLESSICALSPLNFKHALTSHSSCCRNNLPHNCECSFSPLFNLVHALPKFLSQIQWNSLIAKTNTTSAWENPFSHLFLTLGQTAQSQIYREDDGSPTGRCQHRFRPNIFVELMKINWVNLLAYYFRPVNNSYVSSNLICNGFGNHRLPSTWRAIQEHSSRRRDSFGQAHAHKQRRKLLVINAWLNKLHLHITLPRCYYWLELELSTNFPSQHYSYPCD